MGVISWYVHLINIQLPKNVFEQIQQLISSNTASIQGLHMGIRETSEIGLQKGILVENVHWATIPWM